MECRVAYGSTQTNSLAAGRFKATHHAVYFDTMVIDERKEDAAERAKGSVGVAPAALVGEVSSDEGAVPLFKGSDPQSAPPVAVITPVLNEEQAIGLVLDEIPRQWVRHAIVVDNGSSDQTVEVARKAGAHVVSETIIWNAFHG